MTLHLLKEFNVKYKILRGTKDLFENFYNCLNALIIDVIKKVKEGQRNAGVPTVVEGMFAVIRPF